MAPPIGGAEILNSLPSSTLQHHNKSLIKLLPWRPPPKRPRHTIQRAGNPPSLALYISFLFVNLLPRYLAKCSLNASYLSAHGCGRNALAVYMASVDAPSSEAVDPEVGLS